MPKKKETIYSVTLFAQGTTMELLHAIDHIRDALVHGDHTRSQRKIKLLKMTYEFKVAGDGDPDGLKMDRYV